jgi:hypothetical protein
MDKQTTFLLQDAIIENHPSGTLLDIYENNHALYNRCEFRDITIIFRTGTCRPFRGCLFRGCEIHTPSAHDAYWLAGSNTAVDCTINGVKIEDLRTI